jgi:DNA-binding response OmpR family regulator
MRRRKGLAGEECCRGARAIEQGGVSAAVLDFGLGGESVTTVCGHLRERAIPFMFYTGNGDVQSSYPGTIVVEKPASAKMLVTAVTELTMPRTEEFAAA